MIYYRFFPLNLNLVWIAREAQFNRTLIRRRGHRPLSLTRDVRFSLLLWDILNLLSPLVQNISLDNMNARINRIENLLENYLTTTRGKQDNIDEFLRPEIYNLSQDLKKLKSPENPSYLQTPSQIMDNNFDANLYNSVRDESPFKIDEILDNTNMEVVEDYHQDLSEPEPESEPLGLEEFNEMIDQENSV